LVDREELKFLKDIEKLIKREIPKVQVEGFTPSDKPEPEAPRSTQPHGRPPRGHGQGQQKPKPKNAQNQQSGKHLSEAARHQAMPQTPLFSPKPAPKSPAHNPNNRNPNNKNANQNAFGRTNTNPNSTHRSGGRGR
jgi:ATP-dependent RNA helicase RhlE